MKNFFIVISVRFENYLAILAQVFSPDLAFHLPSCRLHKHCGMWRSCRHGGINRIIELSHITDCADKFNKAGGIARLEELNRIVCAAEFNKAGGIAKLEELSREVAVYIENIKILKQVEQTKASVDEQKSAEDEFMALTAMNHEYQRHLDELMALTAMNHEYQRHLDELEDLEDMHLDLIEDFRKLKVGRAQMKRKKRSKVFNKWDFNTNTWNFSKLPHPTPNQRVRVEVN